MGHGGHSGPPLSEIKPPFLQPSSPKPGNYILFELSRFQCSSVGQSILLKLNMEYVAVAGRFERKVLLKVLDVHTTTAYDGADVSHHPFLILALDGHNNSQGKNLQYLLVGRLGRPHRWSELYGEDRYLLHLLGIKPQLLGCMANSLVPIIIQISWFLSETGQNERGFALLKASSLSMVHQHTLPADYFYSLCFTLYLYTPLTSGIKASQNPHYCLTLTSSSCRV